MAYATGTLNYIYGGPIEGAWKLWEYTTTDALSAVIASGYVTDATAKGMSVGDVVMMINQTNPQGYFLQVQSMTAAVGNVAGTATLAVPAGVAGANLANFRNLIDGGDFTTNPWQRGTSFTSIANTLTYTADRFFAVGGSSSSISVSQQSMTAVVGFNQALQFGRASSNANTAAINLGQVLETGDSIRCPGQTVTPSFWAQAGANWSPASGNLNVLLASGTGTNQSAANLVAGSWTGYSSLTLTPQQGPVAAAANIAQPITTTWTRYSFTAPVPATATQLGVLFNATPVGTAGAADYVQIMGAQLEIGSQATPFEHRDMEVELALAQRYAWVINEPASGVVVSQGNVTASNTETFVIGLPTPMFKAPSVTVTVGSFKCVSATAGTVAATSLSGNATHTTTQIGLNATATGTAGQAATLQGGGGSGSIVVTADF
jgi:hypothetical protein